jgi:hypothetical protein
MRRGLRRAGARFRAVRLGASRVPRVLTVAELAARLLGAKAATAVTTTGVAVARGILRAPWAKAGVGVIGARRARSGL